MNSARPIILLVDNGSKRPEPTLRLRELAGQTGEIAGGQVLPVSMLHSDSVDAALLGGEPARTFEPTLSELAEAGQRDILVQPLFIGPSGAITGFLPSLARKVAKRYKGLNVSFAPPLADPATGGVAGLLKILEDNVRRTLEGSDLKRPPVILVDHGSPAPAVTKLRDALADALGEAMRADVSKVVAASMERREGGEYAFNEPLLETALLAGDIPAGPVVVAMLFLLQGRHAGPDGDVARICAGAEAARPGLRCVMTPLIGDHSGFANFLGQRVRLALERYNSGKGGM